MSGVSGSEAPQSRQRWRLLLGEPAEDVLEATLTAAQQGMDRALSALYEAEPVGAPPSDVAPRSSSLAASAPRVARWLGDIRTYFPTSVVQVLQRDAVERLNLTSMLLEPELLSSVQPDVHLVGTLVGLNHVMPETTKSTARAVVRSVVAEIERRVAERTRSAVSGALNRASRTRRPRWSDVDLGATIGRNLDHYLPEYATLVPERLVGHARTSRGMAAHVIVAIDQSGSMAESLVYASVFGAVLASMHTIRTSLVAFDTAVVDLSDKLADPVDVLFGCQLGGGTDINRAVAHCASLVDTPSETVLVLISDLYEGGSEEDLVRRVRQLVWAGVRMIALLALSDSGAPAYDHELAAVLTELSVPTFACTPDAFPDLLAVAISRGDVAQWAAADQAARQRVR
jgi:Mg-chelatase subunit ChlD